MPRPEAVEAEAGQAFGERAGPIVSREARRGEAGERGEGRAKEKPRATRVAWPPGASLFLAANFPLRQDPPGRPRLRACLGLFPPPVAARP